MSFRRNILVQALIIMEFLLSLSPKAREKLANLKAPNKSVTYIDQQLSEEDTKWVFDMKRSIGDYLRQGPDGPFYFRMVETVLSRDKNWVRWKMENCPSIALPQLSPQIFAEAQATAAKLATYKRLRTTPLGSLNLDFLHEDEGDVLAKFKAPERYEYPELQSFRRGIQEDQLEIDMPLNPQSKATAIERKASRTWKALRLASRTRLAVFDKIDNDDNIDIVFEDDGLVDSDGVNDMADVTVSGGMAKHMEDSRPIVIVDPAARAIARWRRKRQGQKAQYQESLTRQLCQRHKGTLAWVLSQTTRAPYDGEESGQNAHLMSSQDFARARDNDHFLEFEDSGSEHCGILRDAVDKINNLSSEVPVLETSQNVSEPCAHSPLQDHRVLLTLLHET